MIERRTAYDCVFVWIELSHYPPAEYISFNHNTHYRINDIIYTEYSVAFSDAYHEACRKMAVWEKLKSD